MLFILVLKKSKYAVETKDLSISWGEVNVLNNLNFKLNDGEKLAVVGPSGSGKSTILKILAGLILPTKGELKIFGEKQKIGSVFLLLFLIPTTIIFHLFPFHQRAVFINLGLIGGLIIAAIREPK